MRRLVSDTLIIAERNLVRLPRAPDLLLAFTVQPIMFVLLFRYVFGGAISTPGVPYVDYLIPGIIVQNIAFGGFVTALGLNEDLHKGLIDRFRSLPMARPAVLAGRTFADIATNALSITILLVTGVIIGFSFDSTVGKVVLGIVLLLVFGYAFSWVFAFLGLIVSSPESANSVGFIAVFPLTFISSAFVPVASMPEPLKAFAQVNPISIVVNAMRSLWVGFPAGNNVWGAFVWCAVIFAVFAPIAVSPLPARGGQVEGGVAVGAGAGEAAGAPALGVEVGQLSGDGAEVSGGDVVEHPGVDRHRVGGFDDLQGAGLLGEVDERGGFDHPVAAPRGDAVAVGVAGEGGDGARVAVQETQDFIAALGAGEWLVAGHDDPALSCPSELAG